MTAQSGGPDAPTGGAEQWAYDPSGNITQTLEPMAGSSQNVTTTYTYDSQTPNELLSQHTRRAEALGSGRLQVQRLMLLPVALPSVIEQQRA